MARARDAADESLSLEERLERGEAQSANPLPLDNRTMLTLLMWGIPVLFVLKLCFRV